jgi:hypothetical protein
MATTARISEGSRLSLSRASRSGARSRRAEQGLHDPVLLHRAIDGTDALDEELAVPPSAAAVALEGLDVAELRVFPTDAPAR